LINKAKLDPNDKNEVSSILNNSKDVVTDVLDKLEELIVGRKDKIVEEAKNLDLSTEETDAALNARKENIALKSQEKAQTKALEKAEQALRDEYEATAAALPRWQDGIVALSGAVSSLFMGF
jgi:Tfp pilus assembly major pilin PilA